MYSCPLHNWGSINSPCPECSKGSYTTTDIPESVTIPTPAPAVEDSGDGTKITKHDIGIICIALTNYRNTLVEYLEWKKDEYSQKTIPKQMSEALEVYNKIRNINQLIASTTPQTESKGVATLTRKLLYHQTLLKIKDVQEEPLYFTKTPTEMLVMINQIVDEAITGDTDLPAKGVDEVERLRALIKGWFASQFTPLASDKFIDDEWNKFKKNNNL